MDEGVSEIGAEEAAALIGAGRAVLVDVREAGEYAAEHIPGAVFHPLSALDPDEIERVAGGRSVIFHCLKGIRAERACLAFAEETGQTEGVYVLSGSLPGWKAAGLPTVAGG